MMDLQIVMQDAGMIFGAIYVLLTAVGNIAPTTKIGQWCRTYAADFQQVEKVVDGKLDEKNS